MSMKGPEKGNGEYSQKLKLKNLRSCWIGQREPQGQITQGDREAPHTLSETYSGYISDMKILMSWGLSFQDVIHHRSLFIARILSIEIDFLEERKRTSSGTGKSLISHGSEKLSHTRGLTGMSTEMLYKGCLFSYPIK